MDSTTCLQQLIMQNDLNDILIIDPGQWYDLIRLKGLSGILFILHNSLYFLTDKRYIDRCNDLTGDIHFEIYQDKLFESINSVLSRQ